jgi:hypothetical protein
VAKEILQITHADIGTNGGITEIKRGGLMFYASLW